MMGKKIYVSTILFVKTHWRITILCPPAKALSKPTKMRLWLYFLLPFTTISNLHAQELRLGADYEKNIIPNLEISGEIEFRKSLNYENYYYPVMQAGASYNFLKNASIGGSIRYSVTPEVEKRNKEVLYEEMDEKWRYTAEFKFKTERFKNDIRISNRLRYQYSSENAEKTRSYLRDRISVDYKLNKKMEPYIAVEPYLFLETGEIRKVRLYMGNELDFFNDKLDIYLIIEANVEEFSTFHAIGLTYKL